MSSLATVTPSLVLHLWHRQPRVNEHSRLIAFSNDLVRALQSGRVQDLARAPLSELDLPRMAYNALRRGGFSYIDEIDCLTSNELLLVNHVGHTSAKQIQDALARWRRGQHIDHFATPDLATTDPPLAAAAPEQVESLVHAFYAWSSDRERMAALLLRAADLISTKGPEDLRTLAMALVDGKDSAAVAEAH